jgi:hypothetical protein
MWMILRLRLLAAALVVLGSSCSLLVDTVDFQCNTAEDCTKRGAEFANSFCNARRVCEMPECLTNASCVNAHNGEPYICRKTDQTCVALRSPECTLKYEPSDLLNENTIWYGLLSGHKTLIHGEAATDLVRSQISKFGQGLPPTSTNGPRRQLAFVACDVDTVPAEMGDTRTTLQRSLDHLLNDVQVPAIIGPNGSGDTVSALTNYTVQRGVLTISPTAAAPAISDISTEGLFFRNSGSDIIAVKALAFVLQTVVEPQLRCGTLTNPPCAPGTTALLPTAADMLKVVVLFKEDALGVSDTTYAGQVLRFNGRNTMENGSNYKPISYGDPADTAGNPMPEARFADAVNQVMLAKPHVLIVFGSTEFGGLTTAATSYKMDKEIEAQWPASLPYRPVWLVVKGIAATLIRDVGTNQNWAKRIYGAQPFIAKTPDYSTYSTNFTNFVSMAGSTYPAAVANNVSVTATPSYYDATYLLAYATVANGDKPLTGKNLADAVRTRLMPPNATRKVSVGYDHIFEVYSALTHGEHIDLDGLTGPLDFDEHGDMKQTQEVFCMQTEALDGGFGIVKGVKASGLNFDPFQDKVVGTVSNCPGPP